MFRKIWMVGLKLTWKNHLIGFWGIYVAVQKLYCNFCEVFLKNIDLIGKLTLFEHFEIDTIMQKFFSDILLSFLYENRISAIFNFHSFPLHILFQAFHYLLKLKYANLIFNWIFLKHFKAFFHGISTEKQHLNFPTSQSLLHPLNTILNDLF